MNKKKLLFVVNPISGGKNKSKIQSYVQKYLSTDRFDWELKYTESSGHAKAIIGENLEKFDSFVAVGGDGTINEIAQELVGTEKSMFIIPMGSGNGLARHLGISLNPRKAIQNLHNCQAIKMDTAILNGHFFLSIAGVGFDSLIAEKFSASKGRGFFNYAKLSAAEFFRYQEQNYQLTLDGTKYQKKAALISFANSNQFGYNTKIAPLAELSNGFLDVCILKKPKWYQMPKLMKQIWTGFAHQSSLLETIKAKHILVEPNPHSFANVDGESMKVEKIIEIKVLPQSLIVMKPQKN